MELNSCYYRIKIWHERRSPKKYAFAHHVFMFYLDLDEALSLRQHSCGVYDYRDEDHISFQGAATAKESVLAYVKQQGLNEEVAKVKLLTNVRTFGYIFNPVSFYYCFDVRNNPLCVVVEIGNTFGELKYFYLGPQNKINEQFSDQQIKYYYISPFIDLDNTLDFKIQIPDEKLNIVIDVLKNGEKFFYSTMTSFKRCKISRQNLIWETLKTPFITLKIISLIHWHAAILHFFKKITHHPKEDNLHNQREVYREWRKI